MEMLGWLALVMLTLTGYSVGAVLSRNIRSNSGSGTQSPTLLDTLTVAGLWICAVYSRLTFLGRWTAVGVWFLGGLAVAFLLNLMQKQGDSGKSIAH
jgi:hypothetical protein